MTVSMPAELDPDVRNSLEQLRVERRAAETERNDRRLAELDEMAAALLTSAGDEPQARRALRQALQARRRIGETQPLAKTRYGLALLESRVAGRQHQARVGFEQAVAEFRESDDGHMVATALLRLADLDLAEGSYDHACIRCGDAADAFGGIGDDAGRLHALRLGARAAHLAGDTTRAGRFLTAAVDASSPEDSLSLRLDAAALGISHEPDEAELDDLLGDASESAHGSLLLLRAAQRIGRRAFEDAESDAQEARRLALDHADPLLYLLSCLQIAGIRQAVDDRTGMLTALFTCQATLGDLLGDDARVPVLQMIRSLHIAWGDERFQSEMRRYRAQFEEDPQ